MLQESPAARRLHTYPFVPSQFYFVPRQWLRDVVTTGDFDARHLLLAMCDGSDRIHYPESAREAHWTRNPDPHTPNVVSHVTYAEALAALQARGWLAVDRDARQAVRLVRVRVDNAPSVRGADPVDEFHPGRHPGRLGRYLPGL